MEYLPENHIKISLQRDELIINDKKKIKTEDTITYAVNADLLSLCPESQEGTLFYERSSLVEEYRLIFVQQSDHLI
ncbi:MAG: hypothetical protein K0S80_4757 [Neobacillus sp.]|nr:hypothetical protein [Neobacillus sp.]